MAKHSAPRVAPTYLRNERTFLDHYFGSVHNKLEADALLFNRKLPHAGMAGAENELALAALLREFLPPRFGVEVSAIVIDRHGGESRQCDIVIYDAWNFPKYLRKVFPIELVYAVIEVKTNLTATEAHAARENLRSVFALDFRPMLTNFWLTRSQENRLLAPPPVGCVFAFRSEATAFETFANWFPFEMVLDGQRLYHTDRGPEIRSVLIGALDKGTIEIASTNLYVDRTVALAPSDATAHTFNLTVAGKRFRVDPAKSLFMFLESLWGSLADHRLHPGFDVRSYMTVPMATILRAGAVAEAPQDWYMAPDPQTPPKQASSPDAET